MSFLNPLFLLGLAAVSLPILVHLVRRTRSPRVEFPSLMFVRRIPQRTIRRRRLHNLLLLLLRSLALLFLVIAFARPYFSKRLLPAGTGRHANVVLVDNSFSMRYGNLFDTARQRARTVVDEMQGNDQAAIVSFGQGYEVVSRLTSDKQALRSAIDGLKPGYSRTDYGQALRGAERILDATDLTGRRVILISDFQATGVRPNEAAYRLKAGVQLVAVDVAQGTASNLAITEVGVQPIIYQQKYTDHLTARITNFGDKPAAHVGVEFLIDEHLVEKREIQVAARESQVVEFSGFNLSEGINPCVIQIAGDDLAIDNRFYLTIRRADQLKALVIDTAVRGRSESFYVRNALTTGENLPFALTIKSAGTVNPGEVTGYRVIILNDAGGVTGALANQLAKFVEAGGGLIIAAGPHTQPEPYNTLFKEITPAALGETVQQRGDYAVLSEVKTDHPVFEVFRKSGRLGSARVFGYHRSTPRDRAAVLARLEDGSPLLVEAPLGGGKVLLFNSTLDASWNDLPLNSLYLPFLRQMARYLGEPEARPWHPWGELFSVPQAKDGSFPSIDTPGNARIRERTQTATGDVLIKAEEPGFYRVRYSDRTDFAAVDLDAQESDLTKLNVEDFVARTSTFKANDSSSAERTISPESGLSDEETESRQKIWWPVLLMAFALFATEAILARRTRRTRVIV